MHATNVTLNRLQRTSLEPKDFLDQNKHVVVQTTDSNVSKEERQESTNNKPHMIQEARHVS